MDATTLPIPPEIFQYGSGGLIVYLASRVILDFLKMKRNDSGGVTEKLGEIVLEQKKQNIETENLVDSIKDLAKAIERSNEIMHKQIESTQDLRQEVQGLSMRIKMRGEF